MTTQIEALQHEQLVRVAAELRRLEADNKELRLKLAEQPAQQEPVACPVCNQVHTILDADESQIIRNAKDGYPDGRAPRLLTLQERVTALCQYASDWKRWCLEKENTTPQAQPAREPLTDDELADLWYKQSLDWMEFARAIEAKLMEKNT